MTNFRTCPGWQEDKTILQNASTIIQLHILFHVVYKHSSFGDEATKTK